MALLAVINRPKVRSAAYQLVFLALLIWLAVEFALNARANLAAQGMSSGFGFLAHTAGFNVNMSLISFQETDTYGRVFLVGLLNTLLVAGLGIVLATVLGFAIGISPCSARCRDRGRALRCLAEFSSTTGASFCRRRSLATIRFTWWRLLCSA